MNAELRVSDAERDAALEALREHAAAGRLTVEELEQRVQAALRAISRGDLARLFADLPADRPRRRRRPRPHVPRQGWAAAAVTAALGALAVAGEPWVLWFLFAVPGVFGKHGGCGLHFGKMRAR